MKELEILQDYLKGLISSTLTIVFLILDLFAVVAVILWVVDDIREGLVVIVFILLVWFGHYLIYRQLRLKLVKFEQSQPSIEYSRMRKAQMFSPSPVTKERRPTHEVLQAWFKNIPFIPLEATIAKDVSARITLFDLDNSKLFDFHGQWAKTNAPSNVGYSDILDTIDIKPGHIESKLFIAFKSPHESSCFAFTREGWISKPSGKLPSYEIPEGEYMILVHLLGVGVNKKFNYRFRNFGGNKSMDLIQN
jgi:hypothetical protein